MRSTSRQNARGYGAKRTKGGWLSRPARRAIGVAPAVQGTHRTDLLPGRSKDTRGLAPQPDPAAVSTEVLRDRATAPCGDRTERAISNGDRASCRMGKVQEP